MEGQILFGKFGSFFNIRLSARKLTMLLFGWRLLIVELESRQSYVAPYGDIGAPAFSIKRNKYTNTQIHKYTNTQIHVSWQRGLTARSTVHSLWCPSIFSAVAIRFFASYPPKPVSAGVIVTDLLFTGNFDINHPPHRPCPEDLKIKNMFWNSSKEVLYFFGSSVLCFACSVASKVLFIVPTLEQT